ncbi:hypothetical protein MIPYR_40311 [uncultured Microbacterium sp.]|uniref:Uncharacterized protein n=1 Tax=uncultured Microbacterium sp. TaxID=191216 RepID=A0A1Y5P4Q7_9MICO|nr:hypothetical protein MIPYR_40311 [uncultured Microbacterium sp.]
MYQAIVITKPVLLAAGAFGALEG